VRGAGGTLTPWVFETYGALGIEGGVEGGQALFRQWVTMAPVDADAEAEEQRLRSVRSLLSEQWQRRFSKISPSPSREGMRESF